MRENVSNLLNFASAIEKLVINRIIDAEHAKSLTKKFLVDNGFAVAKKVENEIIKTEPIKK